MLRQAFNSAETTQDNAPFSCSERGLSVEFASGYKFQSRHLNQNLPQSVKNAHQKVPTEVNISKVVKSKRRDQES